MFSACSHCKSWHAYPGSQSLCVGHTVNVTVDTNTHDLVFLPPMSVPVASNSTLLIVVDWWGSYDSYQVVFYCLHSRAAADKWCLCCFLYCMHGPIDYSVLNINHGVIGPFTCVTQATVNGKSTVVFLQCTSHNHVCPFWKVVANCNLAFHIFIYTSMHPWVEFPNWIFIPSCGCIFGNHTQATLQVASFLTRGVHFFLPTEDDL